MGGGWAEEWGPSHCLAQTETPRHAEPAVVSWSSLGRRLALQAMARWLNVNCLELGHWEEEWQIERRQCSPDHCCDIDRVNLCEGQELGRCWGIKEFVGWDLKS